MRCAFPLALFCAALAGCAVAPRQDVAAGPEAECREVFRRADEAIAAAGVADGMAARVEGFPYLRANRFLASYAGEEMSEAQFADWMNRMAALGREAHAVEVANLPVDAAEALGHALWDIDRQYAWIAPALAGCSTRLAAADLANPERRAALRAAARVPDDYVTWHRVAGLYWFTRIPFAGGINRWHDEVRGTFALPLDALPAAGRLVSYQPPPAARADLAALLKRASANPLGVPEPRGADLDLLLRLFAPAFVVDTAGDADWPGDLGWGADGLPQVVSRRPVVYQRVSHARYGGRALLQLNYSIWFPERPLQAGWDILGGRLDGVLWRVTLAPDGEPWVYDSMHLCGCYHLFFPTARAAAKAQPDTLDETAFVPQALARVAPGARLELRLASGTHYLQRVVTRDSPAPGALEYAFADDDDLRSLPLPGGGRRSAFRPDGIVPGTERGERWLFWPMGVPEPGAMRQWGRHATAFVGRRHFDDPALLERYFTLKK
jgi:hypothetical protein